jgi:hypothetical protein
MSRENSAAKNKGVGKKILALSRREIKILYSLIRDVNYNSKFAQENWINIYTLADKLIAMYVEFYGKKIIGLGGTMRTRDIYNILEQLYFEEKKCVDIGKMDRADGIKIAINMINNTIKNHKANLESRAIKIVNRKKFGVGIPI